MKQTATMKPVTSTFTKKVGQPTYKVNVFFAENATATFEDKLLHLMVNDIVNRKQSTLDRAVLSADNLPLHNMADSVI